MLMIRNLGCLSKVQIGEVELARMVADLLKSAISTGNVRSQEAWQKWDCHVVGRANVSQRSSTSTCTQVPPQNPHTWHLSSRVAPSSPEVLLVTAQAPFQTAEISVTKTGSM